MLLMNLHHHLLQQSLEAAGRFQCVSRKRGGKMKTVLIYFSSNTLKIGGFLSHSLKPKPGEQMFFSKYRSRTALQ